MRYELCIEGDGGNIDIKHKDVIQKVDVKIYQKDKSANDRSDQLFGEVTIQGLLNEKYAIKSLWRAEREKSYYYVSDELFVETDRDFRAIEDERRYRNKNYFETEELAEEFREKIKEVLKNNR